MEERKISDYIKQKLGKRKRKKQAEENSVKDSNSITDFFDRGDKRKSKSIKLPSVLSDTVEEETDDDILSRNKKEKEKERIMDNSEDEEEMDVFLSSESEKEEIKDKKDEISKNNLEFENIKNKINNLVPDLINEINKNLDTQKALLNNDDLTPSFDDEKKKKETNNKNKNNKDHKKNNNKPTIEEDEDDLIEMSSLEGYKKIHIVFYGYKLMPNKEFVRIFPLTLEVPETAKFKTVFKAYCAGTNLNEDDMLFNYNNIEIFSTSTLKGLDMTSSLENYRIDVFYRVEYPTYKYQLKVQQIFKEEMKKEAEKQKMEYNKLLIDDSKYDDVDDDDFPSDRNINIIIQDKNKNETKVSINKNDTIEKLGLIYIEKLSLKKSILPKLKFYFDGQKLSKNETIKEIDIENQDIIDLKIED